MTRYRLFQGKLREHPEGEWVRYEDVERENDNRDREGEMLEYMRQICETEREP
jgi:hypothetical protein